MIQAVEPDYEHLINRTIKKLNIPFGMLDEARSHALLIVATALGEFDPSKGVPLEAFICTSIRWGILNWQSREYKQNHAPEDAWATTPDTILPRIHLQEVVGAAKACLDRSEYLALIGSALGLYNHELSRALRMNGKQLEELKNIAREKLMRELGL